MLMGGSYQLLRWLLDPLLKQLYLVLQTTMVPSHGSHRPGDPHAQDNFRTYWVWIPQYIAVTSQGMRTRTYNHHQTLTG